MINRAAVILKYREPAAQWVNDADLYIDNPGITLSSINQDGTVYLVREEDSDSPDALDRWLELNFRALFELELDGWYTAPELWPKDLTMGRVPQPC